jgi:hypothetical protein
MLIHHDPDEWENVHGGTVCAYHQSNPGKPYAGCCCSAYFGQRRRDPAEVAKIRAEKQREHEDAVLAEAEMIRLRRAQAST